MTPTTGTLAPARRLFAHVLAEWVDEIEQRMKDAPVDQLALIVDLGLHGQRLIAEANILGQIKAHEFALESRK